MDQRFAVTSDGTVWSTVGVNTYVGGPQGDSGLYRYDPATATWEPAHPLGGDEDLPAWLAPTPSGGLWVLLLTDWHADESVWLLASLDVAADEWSVYQLPGSYPTVFPLGAMGADDESVWLSFRDELLRFDGQTFTAYMAPVFEELGVGADGTIWAYRETWLEVSEALAEGFHMVRSVAQPPPGQGSPCPRVGRVATPKGAPTTLEELSARRSLLLMRLPALRHRAYTSRGCPTGPPSTSPP